MAINTFSTFYYGYEIDSTNNKLDFNEGAGDLIATVASGTYTLTDFLSAVKTALDAAGTQAYTVSVNRGTRLVTISASSNFSLLLSSGASVGESTWSLLGFTQGSDLSATNSYAGLSASGSEYQPQFLLQDYVDSENNQEKRQVSVNESASGVVEVINFGTDKRYRMNIRYITDNTQDGKVIKNNASGVSDARSFLEYCISKGELEFMPDIGTPATYSKVILETTSDSRTGTSFRLRELFQSNLPGYYETGLLTFRVVS